MRTALQDNIAGDIGHLPRGNAGPTWREVDPSLLLPQSIRT